MEETALDDAAGFLLGIFLLIPGLILLAIGVFLVMRTCRFLRTAVETTSTIVELRVGPDINMYQAVVEFKTHEGQTIRWSQNGFHKPALGDVGDEIPMKYNPKNPNQARIARFVSMWFVGGILSILGLACGGIGLLFILDVWEMTWSDN